MSDSLGTLQFKDSDKADRAVIVLLCIYGVSDHGVYGDIYNHNFKENIQFYGIGAVSYTHLDVYKRQVHMA